MNRNDVIKMIEADNAIVVSSPKDGFNGLIGHKDGTWTFRYSFFYTMGETSRGYAARIAEVDPRITVIEHRTVYQNWPRDSYFAVRFSIKES